MLQDLWATATCQPQRPHKLYGDLHSVLLFLPYRVGSASQYPSRPPTHMQLGAWTGTLEAGILTKSWSLGINPDPQGYSLGSSERTDGWYLNQTPCDCVMLSRHGMQPVPQPPGPYAADEGPSHATPRDQHISPVSPRVHCPMARGPSSCIWKKCTTASFSCLHGHPLGPTASACIFISVSLKWYVTPYCSEYPC